MKKNTRIYAPMTAIGVSTILLAFGNICQNVEIKKLEKEIELLKEYKQEVEEIATNNYMVLTVDNKYYVVESNNNILNINEDGDVMFIDINNNAITVPADKIECKGQYLSVLEAKQAISDFAEPTVPADDEWEKKEPKKLDR